MKLKLDDEGQVVTREENGELLPVYVDGNKEIAFNAAAARAKIKEQAEDLAEVEKTTDKARKDLEKRLRSYERAGTVEEVRAAVSTVSALKDKDLDATELPVQMERIKTERDALKDKLVELEESVEQLKAREYRLTVGHAISSSEFIKRELIADIGPSVIEKLYGDDIKLEEGKTVPYRDGKPFMVVDDDGNARIGTVDEYLATVVPAALRKPDNARGSDATNIQKDGTPHPTIRTKADLRGDKQKVEYIAKYGRAAFEQLPSGR